MIEREVLTTHKATFSGHTPVPSFRRSFTFRCHRFRDSRDDRLFVVYPSPLTVLADAPVAYREPRGGWAPGVEFLREVPTVWNETHGIAGAFGKWIAVARRQGKSWYIGALTDEQARTVSLPLSFLGKGKWRVRAWLDGTSPPALDRRQVTVSNDTKLRIRLDASGGAALILDQ